MMRLIAAVAAGYLVMTALVILGDVVFEGSADFSFLNLLLAFPYGFVGGWLAARIAIEREITAGLITGVVAALMSVVSYELNPGRQPLWYWTALTASLTAGAVYGSFRRFLTVQRNAPRKKKKAAK